MRTVRTPVVCLIRIDVSALRHSEVSVARGSGFRSTLSPNSSQIGTRFSKRDRRSTPSAVSKSQPSTSQRLSNQRLPMETRNRKRLVSYRGSLLSISTHHNWLETWTRYLREGGLPSRGRFTERRPSQHVCL